MNNKPKILFFDLETAPNAGLFWSLYIDGMLPFENITRERYIICASWKWQGDSEVYTSSVSSSDPCNDLKVVKDIRKAIEEADAVVAHNGDKFDIRWLNGRIIFYGLDPLPNVVQIDTKKIAKNKFYFNSNRLDYLAQYLGIGCKIKTEYGLWKDCIKGDKTALEKMVRYNKKDVRLLEQVFDKLIPFVNSKINHRLFTDRDVCESCGSKHIQYRGYTFTRSRKYKRYQCQDCGHWGRSVKPVIEEAKDG